MPSGSTRCLFTPVRVNLAPDCSTVSERRPGANFFTSETPVQFLRMGLKRDEWWMERSPTPSQGEINWLAYFRGYDNGFTGQRTGPSGLDNHTDLGHGDWDACDQRRA